MVPDDFDEYVRSLGYTVDVVTGADSLEYSVVRDVAIKTGGLKGQVCDIALHRPPAVPYGVPAAIHTKPHLLPMNASAPYATQAGHIGPEWQYWSRRYDRPPTPKGIWTHILTVLGEM
jgi:hypothetical protein